jgi:hypothetical protein
MRQPIPALDALAAWRELVLRLTGIDPITAVEKVVESTQPFARRVVFGAWASGKNGGHNGASARAGLGGGGGGGGAGGGRSNPGSPDSWEQRQPPNMYPVRLEQENTPSLPQPCTRKLYRGSGVLCAPSQIERRSGSAATSGGGVGCAGRMVFSESMAKRPFGQAHSFEALSASTGLGHQAHPLAAATAATIQTRRGQLHPR